MSPQKRIPRVRRDAALATLRAQGRLEELAVREQLALLSELRRDVLAAIVRATGYRFFNLSQLLSLIDREIASGRTAAEVLARDRLTAAFRGGDELVQGALLSIGRPSLLGISPELLQAVIEVTTDQVRSVWGELGARLKTTVRRAAIGITDPNEAIKSLASVIRDVKTFGSAENRAETIIRTEVNRTFSLATQKRMEQSDERLGRGLKKFWLDADDDRVRDAHRIAGERYGVKGEPGPIPVGKAFLVDGEELMFPRDPRGSAGNTINCRCVSVPYVEDLVAGSGAVAAA